MKIGRSIKIILEATKLTRGQITARLRINKSHLSVLENNKCNGGKKILKKISKTFNIPAIYVIAASDQNFRKQFPDTYNKIKSSMETLATESIMKLEKNPVA